MPKTSLFVLERDRPRMPQLYLEGFDRPNNLIYIGAYSVLDAKRVLVLPNHWLSQFVGNSQMEEYWGISYRGGKPVVRNYDVVNGLGYSERRSEHILAGYSDELTQLRDSANEIHRMLDVLPVRTGRRAENLRHALLRIHHREEVVRSIIADRAVRDVNLHLAFNRAITRMTLFAATLERWSVAIRYNQNRIPNRAVLPMLNWIVQETPYFASREIQPLLVQTTLALKVLLQTLKPEEGATVITSQVIDRLSGLLLTAATELQRQADNVPEAEKEAASLVRTGRI